mgnify:CR=1 FL=1
MYKLVAIDLDGTLLNSYGEVSENTKEEIKKAINNGVEVVLASGRPISSVEDLANDLHANHYLISGNGAIVYDMQKSQIVYDKFLSKEQVLNIVKICEENSIYYNIYTENGIIAKNLNYNTLYYYKDNLTKPDENRTHINLVEDIYNYIAIDLLAPDNAMGQYNRIADEILTLDTFPERFRIMDSEPEKRMELRRMLVDNYSVFYTIRDERVIVTDVLYTASDIEARLRGEL